MTATSADLVDKFLSSVLCHGSARPREWRHGLVRPTTMRPLALNLLRDLDEAQRSGNDKKLAKVRRRLEARLPRLPEASLALRFPRAKMRQSI